MKKIITKKELMAKLKAIEPKNKEQRNELVCALIGHSNIESTFFGYRYCGRCEAQIGDSLGSIYENPNSVVIGHNCKICRKNYKKLTWRDKLYCPDPFKKEK